MKKTLLSLLTLMVTATAALAGEYEINFAEQGYENAQDIESVKIGAVTLSFTKGDNQNGTKYYTSGTAIRVYASNTLTFESSETITNIEFTFATGYSALMEGSAASAGSLSADLTYWKGSANSVTITNGTGTKGQTRIAAIKVITGGDNTDYVPAPRFSVSEGTYYEPQTVSLSAGDGLTIYYKMAGDEDFSAYQTPISLQNEQTYTIMAYAQNADGKTSETVMATYTISAMQTFTSLSELKAACTAANQNEAPTVRLQIDGNMRFSYCGSGYNFIHDGKQGFLIYGRQDKFTATGKALKGYIEGKLYIYNETHELAFTDQLANVEETADSLIFDAKTFSYDDLNYAQDESDVFAITGTFAAGELTNYQVLFNDEESNQITLHDRWDVLKEKGFNTEDTYNVLAILSKYKGEDVFYVMSALTDGEVPVDTIEVPTDTVIVEPISIANTPETAYTVEQALQFIAAGESLTDTVYVKGIVSGIKSINPEKYERAQYYIKTSLDAADSLYVYNGYYVDGAAFTDAEQLQVGDEVIICGVLTIYKETPEFDANNYIYSLKREGEEEPTERITIGDITDLIERYLEQEQ